MKFSSIIALTILVQPLDSAGAYPSLVFSKCSDTGTHVAVESAGDHYLVHFHVRIHECAGKEVFVRVRCQYAVGSTNHMTNRTQHVMITGENELWSIYFRVPRFLNSTTQRRAKYQIELGVHRPTEIESFMTLNIFSWQIDSSTGRERMVQPDNVTIPIWVKTAKIRGGRVVVEYGQVASKPVAKPTYRMTGNIDVGNIRGERAAKKL